MQALILKKDALLLPVLCTRMLRCSRILWWKFGSNKIFSFLKLLFYFSFFPQCFWANVSMKPTVIEQANNNCESFNKSLIVFGKLSVCQKSWIVKLAVNWKNGNDVTIFRYEIVVKFFWRCFVSLVNFRYWSKFYVNIISGSGVMTILFYKGLTRNPKIRNTPVLALPNIWRLGQVRNTKLGMNVPNKMLLNAAKFQGNSFYRFWVIKQKPIGVR